MARLARFLAEHGWRTAVLTVKGTYYESRDESMSNDQLTIYRMPMLPSLRRLHARGKDLLGPLSRRGTEKPAAQEGGAGPAGRAAASEPAGAAPTGPGRGIRRLILSLLWCPDDKVGWHPFGLARCLVLRRRYAIVYSSSPPHSTHLIPLAASYLLRGFRWVAEFRDPWTDTTKPASLVSAVSRWLERKWEAAVIRRSTAVVVVTDAMKRRFIEMYPECADKFRVFYNGYDSGEIAALIGPMPPRQRTKTTFVHAGSFYIGRDPTILLRAIAELIAEGALRRDRVEVLFMGDPLVNETVPIVDVAAGFGLQDVVRYLGLVPYRECLRHMSNADVLLLFNINQPLQVPAKLFEYMALRKRILSISTGGITDELIARTGLGVSIRPDDLAGMKRAVARFADEPPPAANERAIEDFDLKSIFGELDRELETLMGGRIERSDPVRRGADHPGALPPEDSKRGGRIS
jgi:glycosyltransferase involved in cell wall biosynthesis